jgi:hypothetical protein
MNLEALQSFHNEALSKKLEERPINTTTKDMNSMKHF